MAAKPPITAYLPTVCPASATPFTIIALSQCGNREQYVLLPLLSNFLPKVVWPEAIY
jgi:hypothetical protein